MPFCHFFIRIPSDKLQLRDLRKKGLVESAAKLGEHLKNRRLDLGLTQAQAAARLGVLREVYDRWERNEHEPVVSVWPNIIAFLRYYPGHPVTSPSNLALMARRVTGLAQKAIARRVGVIHQEFRRWERGKALPSGGALEKLEGIVQAATSARSLRLQERHDWQRYL